MLRVYNLKHAKSATIQELKVLQTRNATVTGYIQELKVKEPEVARINNDMYKRGNVARHGSCIDAVSFLGLKSQVSNERVKRCGLRIGYGI